MEVIFGFAIVVGAAYAITGLFDGARRGGARAYRKRAASWRSKHPSGVGLVGKAAGVAGEIAAAGAAAILTGALEGARGAKAGWRAGWVKGRAKGEAWQQRRETTRQLDTVADQDTGPIPHIEPVAPPVNVESHPSTTDQAGPGTVDTTEGTQPMPTTTTSGEVLTLDQLLEELNAIREDAGAELDDAHADQKRARDDVNRMENIQASLETMHLDGKTLGDIAALGETAQLRAQAADQRAAAADARAAQAAATYQGVQQRHGQLFEAYQTTPQPADQQFYKAS